MDKQLQQQLRATDPKQRALALKEVARRGDTDYLPYLVHLHKNDPDPRIRKMALEAGKRFQPAQSTQIKQISAQKSLAPVASQLPSKADLDRIQQEKKARLSTGRRRYSPTSLLIFFLFILTVVVVGGYVVWQQYQVVNSPGQRFLRAAADPVALPPANGNLKIEPLNGELFFANLNSQTSYYVLEPIGPMPTRGWPLVMGIHGSGGNGQHMLGIGEKTQNTGFLLIAPTFSPAQPGSDLYDGEYMSRDIQGILREIQARYDIDNNATVLYGFSMGGSITAQYVARNPGMFDGAGVLGSPTIPSPPSGSDVRYVVMAGADDPRQTAVGTFMQNMVNRGTPVWFGEIEPGVGHWMSPHMEDKIIELTQSLQ